MSTKAILEEKKLRSTTDSGKNNNNSDWGVIKPVETGDRYSFSSAHRNTDAFKKYWLKQFEDQVPVLEMPTDYRRPLKQSFKSSTVKGEIDRLVLKRISQLSEKTGATEYMILISALMIMLMKYSRQEDIVIGTPVSIRNVKNTEAVPGMLENIIVLRGKPEKDKIYTDFLNEIKEVTLEAYENREYTFEELVEELHITKDASRNPLFDIAFVFRENEELQGSMKGAAIEKYGTVESNTQGLDLTVNVVCKELGYEISFEYCTGLYKEETVKRMLMHYCKVLDEILDNPHGRLSDIDMITETEISTILNEFNNSAVPYPKEKTVVELFEKQVRMTPSKTAVMFEGEKVTYAELNEKANCIANRLKRIGVGRDDRVAILAEKSILMIAGVIGIIKAGGAYVPISPDFPKDRIAYMLEDCNAKAVLVYNAKEEISGREIIDLGDRDMYLDGTDNPEKINSENDLIYVIYTSGTTGNPKGVMVEHKSVIRLVINPNYVELNKDTVILQTGQMTFDASTFEVWGALLNGGSLHLAKDNTILDVNKLEKVIRNEKINTLWLTSTLFNQMFDGNRRMFDTVKYLLIGGEKLSQTHVSEFKNCNEYTTLINGYGPTESTTFTTTYTIPKGTDDIPIGKPINNTKVYVMNDNKLCAIGVTGELCIAGDGLARGYINNEKLTKEKFIKSPFSDEILYKSGDLVKWGPDGNIYYVGRMDEQVKIRGFRIELGEIDTVLRKVDGIKDCAVIVRTDRMQDKAIYAYFVSDSEIDIKEIRNELRKELPEYMIPAYMMQVDSIPVTRNGKLDRKALPDIEMRYCEEYEAPENEIEAAVCEVFAQILNAERVSAGSSFYELGGDSIKAIRVVSKLREYGYVTNVSDILSYKTARNLAAGIEKGSGTLCDQGEVSGEFDFTPIIHFFNESGLGKPEYFNQSMLIKLHNADANAVKNVFARIVEHHDALRAVMKEKCMYIRKACEGRLYDYYEYETGCSNIEEYINKLGAGIEAAFDLENGPLVKLFLLKGKETQYLLIMIHHLVVDGVSWRIILEDFTKGYDQYVNGEDIKLPLKTSSYKKWAEKLKEYAVGSRLSEELKYWITVDKMIAMGAVKGQLNEAVRYSSTEFYVDKDVTLKILKESGARYNAEINDILMAAFGTAINRVIGQKYVTVEMEGHGREPVMEDVIIDRTVGWFTSMYPIILDIQDSIAKTIACTKEMFRNIPANGFGYNVLKYLTDTEFNDDIDIRFNYLGEFEEGASGGIVFSESPCGDEMSTDNKFGRCISFDGLIKNGRLYFKVMYDSGKYDAGFIDSIINKYTEELNNIAADSEPKEGIKVASDYGFSELSVDEFDDMLSAINDIMGD